jgi:NADP-dependent 3-hydroxy acid dehydrogenase YdfG
MSHRVILITGASAGIGRSCSIALSNAFPSEEHPEPLVLVLVGRREAELEKTGKMCREGTTIEIGTGDVGKEEDVERIFKVVKEKYGRLDLLFNVSSRVEGGAELVLMAECRCQPPWRCSYRR